MFLIQYIWLYDKNRTNYRSISLLNFTIMFWYWQCNVHEQYLFTIIWKRTAKKVVICNISRIKLFFSFVLYHLCYKNIFRAQVFCVSLHLIEMLGGYLFSSKVLDCKKVLQCTNISGPWNITDDYSYIVKFYNLKLLKCFTYFSFCVFYFLQHKIYTILFIIRIFMMYYQVFLSYLEKYFCDFK